MISTNFNQNQQQELLPPLTSLLWPGASPAQTKETPNVWPRLPTRTRKSPNQLGNSDSPLPIASLSDLADLQLLNASWLVATLVKAFSATKVYLSEAFSILQSGANVALSNAASTAFLPLLTTPLRVTNPTSHLASKHFLLHNLDRVSKTHQSDSIQSPMDFHKESQAIRKDNTHSFQWPNSLRQPSPERPTALAAWAVRSPPVPTPIWPPMRHCERRPSPKGHSHQSLSLHCTIREHSSPLIAN